MRALLFLLSFSLSLGTVTAQVKPADLAGAWQFTEPSGTRTVLTFADSYLIQTVYEPGRFISTSGGTWQLMGDNLFEVVEFDSNDSSHVGVAERMQVKVANKKLTLRTKTRTLTFDRVAPDRVDQSGSSDQLAGLWRITSRANDAGQLTPMQGGPRKTIKLLTGTRFQWVAINPLTKQFFGTGGGTYVLKDGKYTETIEFFSRDNSRVGKSLTFGAEVSPNEWHHTGQSSTGGPVNEIWSREAGK
ncbi:membrane or secreted protein [Spirosoma rhododendri]|uniref:Membrane or secreted protein n=1 Tax=Spirosoma rhododendri TaxID=2728024 RepID=A0A7L5DRL9_9BACT|nr:membrane or secreted protein [Spirosoma rhododendri]QJD79208.1 membrane or secreted protein [Spirosoma rhododendri]